MNSKKVVLIVGGSGDIGSEIVKGFCNSNSTIIVSYNSNYTKCEKLKLYAKQNNIECNIVKIDVLNFEDVKNKISNIFNEYGRIDILVNAFGILKDNGLIDMTEEEWNEVIQINLTGVFYLCKVYSSLCINNKTFGKIINIGSIKGTYGSRNQCNYAASKAGLIALTKSIAIELKNFITINTVNPGYIKTNLNSNDANKEITATKVSLKPINENLKNLVSFVLLLSNMDNVTGQIFDIDSRCLIC